MMKDTLTSSLLMFPVYYHTIKLLSKVLALSTTPPIVKSFLDKKIRGF